MKHDLRVTLGDGWTLGVTDDGKYVTLSRPGTVVVVPVPSPESLRDLAKVFATASIERELAMESGSYGARRPTAYHPPLGEEEL